MLAKLPPLEKVFEAWSAIASGRTKIDDSSDEASGAASVVSSNREKTYHVEWNGGVYKSDDNATWWQKYPGYPILAVLMLQGKLPYDAELARRFENIDWNALNAREKGDYAKALKSAFADLDLSPEIAARAKEEAEKTIEILKSLDIEARRWVKKRPRQ